MSTASISEDIRAVVYKALVLGLSYRAVCQDMAETCGVSIAPAA
jgi:cytochrome c-type biogenesis protein CcmH/NrfF